MSLSDVAALLLAHEGRIDSYTNPVDVSSPTVNVSNFQPSQKSNTRPPHSGYSSRGRGRGRNFRGGRRGCNPNSGRPVCQICAIQGHVAKRCYYRFDADFIPSHRSHGSSSSSSQRSFGSHPQSSTAVVASSTTELPVEDWWCPDSGASHHVTSYFNNLSVASDYSGNGKIYMGNGEGLSVTHLGHSKFCPSSRSCCLEKSFTCFSYYQEFH